jgi:hypothetical protein
MMSRAESGNSCPAVSAVISGANATELVSLNQHEPQNRQAPNVIRQVGVAVGGGHLPPQLEGFLGDRDRLFPPPHLRQPDRMVVQPHRRTAGLR